MSKLSGDFEVVDLDHQRDMNYVSEHMQAVITLPGTGKIPIQIHRPLMKC